MEASYKIAWTEPKNASWRYAKPEIFEAERKETE